MAADNAVRKQRQRGRPFKPGQSGNPRGKPKGTRHKTTMLAQNLIDDEGEVIVKKLIALAKKGNLLAIKLVVERLVPARRERAVSVALPSVENVSDLPKLTGAVMSSVAEGKLTPEEGARLMAMAAGHARALEVYELERRVVALETEK